MCYSRRALPAVLACLLCAQVQSAPTMPALNASISRPAKFAVFPGCVNSHWQQALAVIKELSKRGHQVQVGSWLCRLQNLLHLIVFCKQI